MKFNFATHIEVTDYSNAAHSPEGGNQILRYVVLVADHLR